MKENLPDGFSGEPTPAAPQHRKICVGLLSYDGKMHCRTAMSLMQAVMQCAAQGWGFTYVLREGDSMVARGRSFIASQFLENPQSKDCTDLVFIDTDLYWDGDDFMKLCSHNVDMVGAAYPYKGDDGNFPLRWNSQGLMEENGLWIVQATTPGFLRVTRRVLERITVECPWLEFKDNGSGGMRSWMFFDNLARHNGVYDEGFVFAEYARQCGFTPYMDPDLNLTHIGQKAFNHGTIRQWLMKKAERAEKLIHDHPSIPPLNLAGMVMTKNHMPTPEEVAEACKDKAIGADEWNADLARQQYDAMTGSKNATNDQHSDPRPAGTPTEDLGAHAPEREPERHPGHGLNGRGRPVNTGQLEVNPAGQANPDFGQTQGG